MGGRKMIAISKPAIGQEEKEAVQNVLELGLLAQGVKVAEFEESFADFIGVKHAVATSSGTTALQVSLLAHRIGPGHEVISTPFTFIASINAILSTGATPVLVDIDESFNINADLIERAITDRTRAIMPVHLYGQPADMEKISNIANKFELSIIEDACQAHGAEFNGKKAGSFGTGCFSFYATKNMTTGEGGMITTNDDRIADSARLLINHGMRKRYYHEQVGYNYRMTDIAGALGIEQLKKLNSFNIRRSKNAKFYGERLGSLKGLLLPRTGYNRTHAWHQYTMRVTQDFPFTRDEMVKNLMGKGIGTGIYYPVPIHLQKTFTGLGWYEGEFPVTERVAREVVSIPIHPLVTHSELEFICEEILALEGAA